MKFKDFEIRPTCFLDGHKVDKGFRMPTHIPEWINKEINEEVTHWMPIPQPPKGE